MTDGEVLKKSVELDGAGKSFEVNEEAGEHSLCLLPAMRGWGGGGGGENGKTF